MNLAFSPTLCPNYLLPETLKFSRNTGFSRIELFRTWTKSSPVHPDTSIRMVREYLQAAGVTLTGLNIRNLTGRKADSDERNLHYNLSQIEWDIHLAKALGLNNVNLKGGDRTSEAQEDLIIGVNRILEKFPNITLNLGNHTGNRLQGLEDYLAIMPHLGNCARILLDTGHFLSTNENILRFAETFADRIGLVHLRDQRGEKPVPFGEGNLPFEDLFAILKGAGFNGILTIELEQVTWDNSQKAAQTARDFVETILT